jgi:hypothetical protein
LPLQFVAYAIAVLGWVAKAYAVTRALPAKPPKAAPKTAKPRKAMTARSKA